jgi:hypothetical protein
MAFRVASGEMWIQDDLSWWWKDAVLHRSEDPSMDILHSPIGEWK